MAMSMLRRMTPRKRVRSPSGPMGPQGSGDGTGRLPFTLPVVERGSRFTAAGVSAPTLVVDLDDTLLQRRGVADTLRLYAPFPNSNSGVLCPFAGEAMDQLATKYRVVAITARYQSCAGNTARWLEANGLGTLPVMFATQMHPYDRSRSAFKAAAIQHLLDEGWEPVAGVGDRPSDLLAYARCDLHTLAVCHTVATEGQVAAAARQQHGGGSARYEYGSSEGSGSDAGTDSEVEEEARRDATAAQGRAPRRRKRFHRSADPFDAMRRAARAEAVDPAMVHFFQALPNLPVWRQVLDALLRTPGL